MGKMSLVLDLNDKTVVVFGGGKVGQRRAGTFAKVSKQVIVVSSKYTRRLGSMTKIQPNLLLVKRRVGDLRAVEGFISKAFIVIPATNNRELNHMIAERCRSMGKLVNLPDDVTKTDVIVPATIRKNGLEVAISTHGKSPLFSKYLKSKLEKLITKIDLLHMDIQVYSRELAMGKISNYKARRKMLLRILKDSKVNELIKKGRVEDAKAVAKTIIEGL